MRTFILIALSSMTLTACNTIAGAGEDLTVAGQAMTLEAREIQRDL